MSNDDTNGTRQSARERRRAAEVAARRRLLELDPTGVRDIEAAAACFCACHPRPADPDSHGGGRSCPCQLTPEELRALRARTSKLLKEHSTALEAAQREREQRLVDIAADLGIEAREDNLYAPWVIVGRVDGRGFRMRERSDRYAIVIAPDDSPTIDPWNAPDGTQTITVRTGDASDLGNVGPPDYRLALTVITETIRTFLRQRTCPHPHADGDWYCPRCGLTLVDLTRPPAETSVDDERRVEETPDP
ncbi:hypothetical protein CSO01_36710 [Cellulomonas soli]|uniref:Uncharacterized protein n=2 Tax=Cellulomonas soli TaxID=931535 RepID=A0A512PID6_9CELL|nr:hypothetical protein CSO01_36710 [Cellulomonas soli]